MSESEWQKWDCQKWNSELFRHYFVVNDGEALEPVESLCVTADELRKVTGDLTADPEKVQESLLKFVLGSLGQAKSGKAFERRMRQHSKSPGHLSGLKIPAGFVYLIVSCLAANQVLEDEESALNQKTLNDFREVLAKLLRVDDVLISQDLAQTWTELAGYLEDGFVSLDDGSKIQVRPLRLPNPGNETHIGYSKKLVFPNRADQRRLLGILSQNALIEENPAPDAVVLAVGAALRTFSQPFREAFEDFRTSLRSGAPLSNLVSHKFWSAVKSTCANDLLIASINQTVYAILIDIEDNYPSFNLVANGEHVLNKFEKIELDDFSVPGWQYRLTLSGDETKTVASLLSNSTGLGSLTSLINGGVIPFVQRDDYRFETVNYVREEGFGCVLVRDELVSGVQLAAEKSRFLRIHESIFDGWSLIENIKLKSYSDEDLKAFGLQNVQVLRRRIMKPSIRIQSLFQLGDEYLGWAKLLPKIIAPGFEHVSLSVDRSEVPLRQIGDAWLLQEQDLQGTAIVLATIGSQTITRTFKFVDVPSSDAYLQPTDPAGLMIEVNTGTENYESFVNRRAKDELSFIPNTVHRTYFGRHQGEFLTSSEDALVEISFFGDQSEVRFGNYESALADLGELNNERSGNRALKRKWRQRLSEIANQEAVQGNDEVATRLRKLADPRSAIGAKVPAISEYSSPPTPYEDSSRAMESRKILQAAIGARALRRKGMSRQVWMSMIKEIFEIDGEEARFIHRGWIESGIIDELISIRSPGSAVFARRPRLEVFQSENGVMGGVVGLVMPERFENLKAHAEKLGLQTTTNLGPSQMVPPHLRVRSDSVTQLQAFAKDLRLDFHYLSGVPFESEAPRELGARPSRTYSERKNNPVFGIKSEVDIDVRLFESTRAPLVWSVESGSDRAWTFSGAHSEHLLIALSGVENFTRRSAVDLVVNSAFIPLQAARWITVVSGVPSGPEHSGTYIYRFASPAMLESFVEKYRHALEDELKYWNNGGER